MRPTTKENSVESPIKQLDSFISKFTPAVAKTLRSARRSVRQRLPSAIEQVYDNYNFLAIGYCSSEKTSDCIVSLAASAKGVILSFYYGATLPDPHQLLQGEGKQNRFIRINDAKILVEPAVEALIAAAVAQAKRTTAAMQR